MRNKAFQEIAQGERTASAMEAHLDALESKIDELLAQAESHQQNLGKQQEEASSKDEKTDQPKSS